MSEKVKDKWSKKNPSMWWITLCSSIGGQRRPPEGDDKLHSPLRDVEMSEWTKGEKTAGRLKGVPQKASQLDELVTLREEKAEEVDVLGGKRCHSITVSFFFYLGINELWGIHLFIFYYLFLFSGYFPFDNKIHLFKILNQQVISQGWILISEVVSPRNKTRVWEAI